MEINQSTLILLASVLPFVGGVVGAAISMLIGQLTRRSEERRQVRALVVQAALESWKQDANGTRFDVYLLHMQKTADVVFAPDTTPSNLKERLKPIDDMVDIMITRGDGLRAEHEQRQQARRLALNQHSGAQQRIPD